MTQRRAVFLLALLTAANPALADDAQIQRGKYLVQITGCSDCHTPGGMLGQPDMARYLGDFARAGLINIAGGCCGNTPEHIAAIARVLEGQPPRRFSDASTEEAYALGGRTRA